MPGALGPRPLPEGTRKEERGSLVRSGVQDVLPQECALAVMAARGTEVGKSKKGTDKLLFSHWDPRVDGQARR